MEHPMPQERRGCLELRMAAADAEQHVDRLVHANGSAVVQATAAYAGEKLEMLNGQRAVQRVVGMACEGKD